MKGLYLQLLLTLKTNFLNFSYLSIHSLIRWFVLIALVLSLIRAYQGWIKNKSKNTFDKILEKFILFFLNLQLLLGLFLYIKSPIVHYFLQNFKTSLPQTELRFFGMEHITAMIISVFLINIGIYKANKKPRKTLYFKTIALWFTPAFIIIFCSIPWSFSPFTSRPDFRFLTDLL